MLPDIDRLLKPRPRRYRRIIKHLSPLVVPVSPTLKKYFQSTRYQGSIQKGQEQLDLSINSGYRKGYDQHWRVIP